MAWRGPPDEEADLRLTEGPVCKPGSAKGAGSHRALEEAGRALPWTFRGAGAGGHLGFGLRDSRTVTE